jgi:hypothetical protein
MRQTNVRLSIGIVVVWTALAVVVLPTLPRAEAQAEWPPRPETPTPTLPATPDPADPDGSTGAQGGKLALHIEFSSQWPWERAPWQDLWTVVQWQDPQGAWHDVVGWRGELDRVVLGDGGRVVGRKVWWVQQRDAGKGPFRWLVYRGEGDLLLARSETFHLPPGDGTTTVVEFQLGEP